MIFDLRPTLSQPLMYFKELQSDFKKAHPANESTSGVQGEDAASSNFLSSSTSPQCVVVQQLRGNASHPQEGQREVSSSGHGSEKNQEVILGPRPPPTHPPLHLSPNRRVDAFAPSSATHADGLNTDETDSVCKDDADGKQHFANDGDAFGEEEDVQWVFLYTPEMNLKSWLTEMNLHELASCLKAAVPMAYDGNEFLFIEPKEGKLASQLGATTAIATVLPSRQKTVFGLGYELGIAHADAILKVLDKKFDFPDYDRSLVLCRGLLVDEEQAAAATVLDALGELSSSGGSSKGSSRAASPSASKVWVDNPLLLASGGSLKLNSQVEEYFKAWIYVAKPKRTPPQSKGGSGTSTNNNVRLVNSSSGSLRIASQASPQPEGELTAVALLAQGIHLPDVAYFEQMLLVLRSWAPIWYYRRIEKFMRCAHEQQKRSDAFGRSTHESSDHHHSGDVAVATSRRTRSPSQHSFGTDSDQPQGAVPGVFMMLPTLSFTETSHSAINGPHSTLVSVDFLGRSSVVGGRSTLGYSIASTTSVWYFAYGSNLSLSQLVLRVGEPMERLPVRLEAYRLVMNKGSGANPRICYANIEGSSGTPTAPGVSRESLEEVYGFTTCLYGVVYRLTGAQLRQMDSFEGGYDRRPVTCEVIASVVGSTACVGEKVDAVAYIATGSRTSKEARPSKEYMQKILEGRELLPPSYVKFLEDIPTSGEDSPRHNLRQGGLL